MEPSRGKATPRRGHIIIFRDTCKGCALCVSVCPQKVLAMSEGLNEKGYYPVEFIGSGEPGADLYCTGCATCALICPDIAIEVYRD